MQPGGGGVSGPGVDSRAGTRGGKGSPRPGGGAGDVLGAAKLLTDDSIMDCCSSILLSTPSPRREGHRGGPASGSRVEGGSLPRSPAPPPPRILGYFSKGGQRQGSLGSSVGSVLGKPPLPRESKRRWRKPLCGTFRPAFKALAGLAQSQWQLDGPLGTHATATHTGQKPPGSEGRTEASAACLCRFRPGSAGGRQSGRMPLGGKRPL